jgi:parallel beta-helix repeat protein
MLLDSGCTCSPVARGLAGLACESNDDCVKGFVCDQGTGTCVATANCIDSDGDGYCSTSDCDDSAYPCNANCDDSDNDGTRACDGDCDDYNPNCIGDCTDNDGDGVAFCAGDCDDNKRHCTLDCTDADGDGYCGAHDCRDDLVACNANCDDSDDDEVPDCIEEACHTDPKNASDTCIVLDNVSTLPSGYDASLTNGVAYANMTAGREKMYLTYPVLFNNDRRSVRSNDGNSCFELRAEPTAVITIPAQTTPPGPSGVFDVIDPGCIFEGLTIVGGGDVIRLTGTDTEIRDCEIRAWALGAAIDVTENAHNTHIVGCHLHGSTVGAGDGQAGIHVQDGVSGTCIVDNRIVGNSAHGIHLHDGSTDTVLDHNTLAENSGSGIEISGNKAPTNLCMRNNIFADNAGYAIRASNTTPTWDETPACTEPLASGPIYGNVEWNNNSGGDVCGGNRCSTPMDCSCLPAGTFWQLSEDPRFDTSYCLGEASMTDACADLGYDLNGMDAGNYSGSAPEPGAQESDSGDCAL